MTQLSIVRDDDRGKITLVFAAIGKKTFLRKATKTQLFSVEPAVLANRQAFCKSLGEFALVLAYT